MNTLLIVADQLRPDWLGNPSIDCRTPNIDALRNAGVTFNNAYTPSPVCAPARACMALAVEYDKSPVQDLDGPDMPDNLPTIHRRLRDESDIHVMSCGKDDLTKRTTYWGPLGDWKLPEMGFSDAIRSEGKWGALVGLKQHTEVRGPYGGMLRNNELAQMFIDDMDERWLDQRYENTNPCTLPDPFYLDTWIASTAKLLLDRRPDKPWFLQVNFAGPHEPMDVTASMWESVQGRAFPQPNLIGGSPLGYGITYSEDKNIAIRQNYTAMVENIDARIGELLAQVDLSDTLVVLTADHGDMLGDHRLWHKTQPYEQSVKVPLIVAGPGVTRRGNTNALASLIDVSETLARRSGFSMNGDGADMSNFLAGGTAFRGVVKSGLLSWRMERPAVGIKTINDYDPDSSVAWAPPNPRNWQVDLTTDPEENNLALV